MRAAPGSAVEPVYRGILGAMVLAAREATSWSLGSLENSSEGQNESTQECGKREIGEQPFHVGPTPLLGLGRAFRKNVTMRTREGYDGINPLSGCRT
jgi:hypothetical protein